MSWIPDDPTLLPTMLAVPRTASALWWPELAVVRVSSTLMERPTSMRALEEAVRAAGLDPAACRWVCADEPYSVPPLAANWARVGLTLKGGRPKIWWALTSLRPQMRINDKAWTWRRAWMGNDQRVGPVVSPEMESDGRAWAAGNGCAYLPHLIPSSPVEASDLGAVRAARGASCA